MLKLYIILIIVMFILIVFMPVQIHIFYQKHNHKDKIKMQIKVLVFSLNKVLSAPLSKILSLMARKKYDQQSIKESLRKKDLPKKNWGLILRRLNIWFPRVIQIISHSLKFTSKILKPIRCKKLKIYSEVGLFDAAQTSLAIGSMWAVYSFMLSQLSKWMVLKPEIPELQIVPNFNQSKLHIEYDCIIVFPLGHIIIVMVQTIRFLRVSSHLTKGITAH